METDKDRIADLLEQQARDRASIHALNAELAENATALARYDKRVTDLINENRSLTDELTRLKTHVSAIELGRVDDH